MNQSEVERTEFLLELSSETGAQAADKFWQTLCGPTIRDIINHISASDAAQFWTAFLFRALSQVLDDLPEEAAKTLLGSIAQALIDEGAPS